MKKLENPTTFFFKQAQNPPDLFRKNIDAFVAKLLDKDTCPLCTRKYDTKVHVPRILIHCGHTFCTPCLGHFYMTRRVRCPNCLKLVKQLEKLQRLPINHTVYEHILKKENKERKALSLPITIPDAKVFLFGEFQRVQKEAHMLENPQKVDPDSGLPFCVFHSDRVEHFHCETHHTSGCRVCIEVGHTRPDCTVLDLYNVRDPQKYLHPMESRLPDIDADVSEPMEKYKKNGPVMFGLNNDDDDEDQENQDQSDSSQEYKDRSL